MITEEEYSKALEAIHELKPMVDKALSIIEKYEDTLKWAQQLAKNYENQQIILSKVKEGDIVFKKFLGNKEEDIVAKPFLRDRIEGLYQRLTVISIDQKYGKLNLEQENGKIIVCYTSEILFEKPEILRWRVIEE